MLLVLVKAVIIYFLVLFCVRLTGKRQLGEMQPFELVIMLMIADLACIPINDAYIPLYSGVVPIIALTFLSIIMSLVARKSLIVRRILSGKSVIVIDRGSINYKHLKQMNLNMHDLLEALRASGNPDINTVEYAIFENNGKICVINKPASKNEAALLPRILLIDGRLNHNVMDICGVTEAQLNSVLKHGKVKRYKDILFMDIRQDGTIYVSPKNGKYFTDTVRIKERW